MAKNSCLVCKKTCQINQKTKCSICKAYAHRRCANVGLNYGVHNFICSSCHQRKARLQRLSLSLNESTDGDHGAQIGSVNQTHSNHIDLAANQDNALVGSAETTDLYLSINNLNSVLQNKTDKDIFAIHFNAVSWVKNFDSFVSLFDRMIHLPDICVTETRFHDDKI